MPEISVIVPVYKVEPYIRRCVDSILSQTFTDFELILVDDGSPDNSGMICDEYTEKDSRVRVIHKDNGGVSSARNAGIDAARGNWITFVDSDDYVTERYLEDLYEPEFDLSIVNFRIIEIKDNSSREGKLKKFYSTQLDETAFEQLIKINGRVWMDFCWGHLYSTEILKEKKLRFDPHITMSEDSIFVIRYFRESNSLCIKESIDYYYLHKYSESLSTRYNVQHFESYVETENLIEKYMSEHKDVSFPFKSFTSMVFHFCDSIPAIANDGSMSFLEKYRSMRYVFKSVFFITALKNPEIYLNNYSAGYQRILKLKSPFLMLFLLLINGKIKGCVKI